MVLDLRVEKLHVCVKRRLASFKLAQLQTQKHTCRARYRYNMYGTVHLVLRCAVVYHMYRYLIGRLFPVSCALSTLLIHLLSLFLSLPSLGATEELRL
jgi:hypothetical protein